MHKTENKSLDIIKNDSDKLAASVTNLPVKNFQELEGQLPVLKFEIEPTGSCPNININNAQKTVTKNKFISKENSKKEALIHTQQFFDKENTKNSIISNNASNTCISTESKQKTNDNIKNCEKIGPELINIESNSFENDFFDLGHLTAQVAKIVTSENQLSNNDRLKINSKRNKVHQPKRKATIVSVNCVRSHPPLRSKNIKDKCSVSCQPFVFTTVLMIFFQLMTYGFLSPEIIMFIKVSFFLHIVELILLQQQILIDNSLLNKDEFIFESNNLSCLGLRNRISQVLDSNSKFLNQLFTPVKIGSVDKNIPAHVQLDSGAGTNLISKDLAKKLSDLGLINFTHEKLGRTLTDVQNNLIAQPQNPINITLIFGNKSINVSFHVVEKLEFPILGLPTMINKNMSIINNGNDSFLYIGGVENPEAVIQNIRTMEDEVLLFDDVVIKQGINKTQCYTHFQNGIVEVKACKTFNKTCITIPTQTVEVRDHLMNIQLINYSQNEMTLASDFKVAKLTNLQSSKCNQVQLDSEDSEGRFSFPLSEEEGLRLLESVEPCNLPALDPGQEPDEIDWEKEVRKPDVFPKDYLEDFIKFVKTEVPNLFSRNEFDCGCLDPKYGYVDDLPTTTDVPPKSYKIPLNSVRAAQIQATFDKLEEYGIVVKGQSPYKTYCLVVPRKDGRQRVCIDYRQLNAICETFNQPVREIANFLQNVANACPRFFTLVDICNAFHSMLLGPEAMRKASIVTPTNQYFPTRLVFGYKNAPALFLQAMQKVFDELPREPNNVQYADFYFDDIIIFSKTKEDHLRHIQSVFRLLHKVGLKIQATKNYFFQYRIELLGKVISGTTISPQKRHIESLKKFPRPTTIKQLQSFLGICTWNCNLVPDYSRTIAPLTKLLRKDQPFEWGQDQEDTFQYLKEFFTETTAQYFVDYSQPIYVAADASDKFIAGVAYQVKSYSAEEIPALKEALQYTKELHKLPAPKNPTKHPLLPKGAIGIPTPFKLTNEGISSPHDPNKLAKQAQSEQFDVPNTEEYLDQQDKLHIVCNIGYFSSSLSKSQEGYSIIEKEAFAVVSSLEFFKTLLQGATEVYVLSDSRPFLFIMKLMRCGISRIQRWAVKLFSLPFTVIMVHVKGTVNYADSFTRVWTVQEDTEPKADLKKAVMVQSPFKIGQLVTYDDLVEVLEKNPNLVSYSIKEPKTGSYFSNCPIKSIKIHYIGTSMVEELKKLISMKEIINHQRIDSFCRGLKENTKYYLFKHAWYKKRKDQLENNDEGRIIVPRSLVSIVIALFHFENHAGSNNLHDQIKSVYYFPNMKPTIAEFIKMCHLCAVYKSSTLPKVPMGKRDVDPVAKSTVWSLDVVEGMPIFNRSDSFLSMVEYYSGFRIITPLKYKTSAEVAKIIEAKIISIFGPPRLMISDGGTNLLKSKNVKKLCNRYGIQTHITTPFHPASHGRIEVSHQSIITLLKIAREMWNESWHNLCNFVQLALNSRPSSTLGGHSPMYFMFGIEPTTRLKNNVKEKDIPDIKEQEQIWKIMDETNKKILEEYNIQRNRLNEKMGGKMVNYDKGEFVWAKNFTKSPKKKVQSRYLTEPLEVIKDFGYAILVRNHLGIVTKLHKNNVKKYTPRNLELYNALPYKFKLKLGSKFDSKELQKYFDDIQKEEQEKIETQVPILIQKDDKTLIDEENNIDTDSDEEDKKEDNNSKPTSDIEPITTVTGTRQPDVPFHMNLRERRVRFT